MAKRKRRRAGAQRRSHLAHKHRMQQPALAAQESSATAPVQAGNHENTTRIPPTDAPAVPHISAPALPWLVWLVVFLIASPPIIGPYGQSGGYTPDLHMAAYIQVFTTLLLAVYLFSRSRTRPIELPHAPMLLPILLLYLWAIASYFWGLNTFEWSRAALNYTGAVLGGLLVLLLVKDMQGFYRVMLAIVFSAFLIALLGIGQFLLGIDWVQQHIVPAATFSNKNMAGQYGLLTFPLAIICFFNAKTKSSTWFFAMVSALLLVFIYYTRTRAVWVSLVVEIILLTAFLAYCRFGQKRTLLLDTHAKKLSLVAGIALTIAMCYMTPAMFGKTDTVTKASIGAGEVVEYHARDGLEIARSTYHGSKSSGRDRFRIWMNSIPMFIDHFFLGVGLGNWTVRYPEYQAWVRQDVLMLENRFHANAHSDYIELICELGFIGVILLVLVLAAFVKTVTALLAARHEFSSRLLMFAPLLALIGIGTDALFSFPLKQPVPLLMIMVYLALLSCAYSFHVSRKQYTLSLPKLVYYRLTSVIPMVMSVFLFIWHYNLFQSEIYYRQSVVYSQKKEDSASDLLRVARAAHDYNPLRTKMQWFKGTALLKLGQSEKAISLFKETLADYPYSQNALYNLVSAYVGLGQYEKAAHYFGKLLSVQKVKSAPAARYMSLLLQTGQYRKIIETIDFYIEQARADVERIQGHDQRRWKDISKLDQARQAFEALQRIKVQAQQSLGTSSG